jgi:hypothetical protein
MSITELLPAALYDFLRTRLAEDESLGAAELHSKMRIIRAWPDPCGNWTADQANAARAMKDQILRAMAAVYSEHPEYRSEWR